MMRLVTRRANAMVTPKNTPMHKEIYKGIFPNGKVEQLKDPFRIKGNYVANLL